MTRCVRLRSSALGCKRFLLGCEFGAHCPFEEDIAMVGTKTWSVFLALMLSLVLGGVGLCQDAGGTSGGESGTAATTSAPAGSDSGAPSGFSMSSGMGSANVTGNSATSPAVELAKLGLQKGTSYSGRALYRAPYGLTVTADYFGQRMTGSATIDENLQVFEGFQTTSETRTTQTTTLVPVVVSGGC